MAAIAVLVILETSSDALAHPSRPARLVDRRGRFAAVTNIRELERPVGLRSRGSLVVDYLAGGGSAERYAARATREGAEFGPFNLLVGDGPDARHAIALA